MEIGLNIINYISNFIVNHSFSVIMSFELFTYILSMVTLKSGIILDQNDDGPLKLANGPYPIKIHANYIIPMDFFKISMGPSQNLMGPIILNISN